MTTTFSVVTTAKNEKDQKLVEETFDNWEATKQIFESKSNRKIDFIIVDAGNNVEFPKMKDSLVVDQKIYEKLRRGLYENGKIKYDGWDSPSIGRNLGFKYAKGKIIIFQDIDTLFSTGTELDYKYINPAIDRYENYFEVMHKSFREKGIVGAAPSARARDSMKISRRFAVMGENYTVWFSTKIKTIRLSSTPVVGPSFPGFSVAVLHSTASRVFADVGYLFDPELAVAEDHKFSRTLAEYGKVSYEKKACAFIRTEKRVSSGFDILKSMLYAVKWIIPYSFPDAYKYRKHELYV